MDVTDVLELLGNLSKVIRRPYVGVVPQYRMTYNSRHSPSSEMDPERTNAITTWIA